LLEGHSFGGQSIEVRSAHVLVSKGAEVIPSHVVGKNHDDVGSLLGLERRQRNESEEERGEAERAIHGGEGTEVRALDTEEKAFISTPCL
jgi:microcompartment protein CcmL/EutN